MQRGEELVRTCRLAMLARCPGNPGTRPGTRLGGSGGRDASLWPWALGSPPGTGQFGRQLILAWSLAFCIQVLALLILLCTKHKDFLESEGCCANTTSSGQRVSPSSSAVLGPSVSELPGPCRASAHLDLAPDLDLKSSSSHSGHSSETSLPEVQKNNYHEEFSLLKLQTKDGQRPEWTFYPRFSSSIHTYHVGKQCFFKGVFLGNKRSLSERTVDKCLGRKKYDIDPRNGIPKLTPGDNPYMYPEQSKGFHKVGSTLPPVNFSLVPYEKKFDTFIPLKPLPQIRNLPFWIKEKANKLKNEIREVKELDDWQPAIPLLYGLISAGGLKTFRE